MRKLRSTIAILSVLAALPGCSSPGGAAATERIPTSAQLDSGNVRFIAGDHAAALAHYRAATSETETAAAAWYGVHMASTALGDTATASDALRQVQQLVPDAALVQHRDFAKPSAPHPVTGPDAPTTPRQ